MKSNFYLMSHGVLRQHEGTLYFVRKLEDELVKTPIPIERVGAIFAYGKVTLSSGCIDLLAKNDVCVHFFNSYGMKIATFMPRHKLASGKVLLAQVSAYNDPSKRMKLASSFVSGAISNMLLNLNYYSKTNPNLELLASEVGRYRTELREATTIEQLMGFEANAHKSYYTFYDMVLKEPFRFEARTRRPPQNYLNSLISFGNSLVYSTVLSEIYSTQLDPTISYLHALYDRRFSLSLDISEVFKPLLADRVIFHLVNKGEIAEGDFSKELNGVLLNDSGRRKFIKHNEEKLATTIKHRKLGREISYRTLIRLECYKLIKHLLGIEEYEPFVMWW